MSVLFVVNPTSGRADDVPVDDLVAAAGPGAAIVKPRSPASFRAEVTAAARGADRIVVVGGDGTLNHAVNAFDYRYDSLRWGLIPAGTGNDLARTLDVPRDPTAALEVALGDNLVEIDVAIARGPECQRLFLNACMGGFAVAVDENATDELKERFGPFAFWIAGARAATNVERSAVSVNGTVLEGCVAAGVGNGKSAGGGIEVWPGADPNDGLLDACAVAVPRATGAAKLIPRLLRGTHEGIDEVVTDSASRIEIDSDPPLEFNVDGDLVGLSTPATFDVVGKLAIAAP